MCLIKPERKKTAKKDIAVYKWGHRVNDIFASGYYKYPFSINKKARKIILKRTYDEKLGIVEKGYHSFTTKENAINDKIGIVDSQVGKFIIPKGTKYYKGKNIIGLYPAYVSETIIFKGFVK